MVRKRQRKPKGDKTEKTEQSLSREGNNEKEMV